MYAMRRQILPAVVMIVVMTILLGVAYPAVTWVVGDLAFHQKITGSFVKEDGKVVGSTLIGQNFLDAAGNPLPQYFQPRPSDSLVSSYNPAAGSSASNLGPTNPLLIGFVPRINTVERNGDAYPIGTRSEPNPFATKADPWCVPMSVGTKAAPSTPVAAPTPGEHFAMSGGTYACDPNTIPERTIAYRQFNGLAANVAVPADAVTASASGLDPDISPANADLQAPRIARERHLALATVDALIARHTSGEQLGFLGEPVVDVVVINLALDRLAPFHS